MKENIKIIQNQIKQENTKQNKTKQNKTKQNNKKTKQDTTKQKRFINTWGNKIDKRKSKWRKERTSFEEGEEDSDRQL